jgi:hypothetical protein
MVCLCSLRVLINEIDVGPQNSEFGRFVIPRVLILDCFTYVVLSLLLGILALRMKLAGLGTATVQNGDVQIYLVQPYTAA